jgi:stearoyl-CoA desaturase (delta-9 desaturase)
VWANNPDGEQSAAPIDEPIERMPPLQTVVMFCSVVGPFIGLLAAIFLLWHHPANHWGIGWPEVLLMVGMYAVIGFGVTIGFHRLLTHKSFETYRPIKWLLAILGSTAGQGMCIRWVATHRRHHQQADRDGDPHSPHLHGKGFRNLLHGLWHAHVAWCFEKDKQDLGRSVPDLLADPVLVVIDQLYFFWVALGILLPGVILGWCTHSWHGFISGVVWGGLLRIFLLQHVTWSINSACHVWGRRPFAISDHSTNNMPIAIISLGEGWHNNHHAFPTSARHGLAWWQFDASWIVLKILAAMGLVWNLRTPSETAMHAKARQSTAAGNGDGERSTLNFQRSNEENANVERPTTNFELPRETPGRSSLGS